MTSRKKYDELFGQALAEYNARQTQASRRIPDYNEHLKKSAKVKPYYEIVVQFGDMDTCGQGSGKWEEAKLMLGEYMRNFEKHNPNLKVFNAVMHLDEATPHLHIDFIPIAHNAAGLFYSAISISDLKKLSCCDILDKKGEFK